MRTSLHNPPGSIRPEDVGVRLRFPVSYLLALLATTVFVACEPKGTQAPPADEPSGEEQAQDVPDEPLVCPPMAQGPEMLPGTRDEHLDPMYWERTLDSQVDVNEALLTPEQAEAHSRAMAHPMTGEPLGVTDLLEEIAPTRVQTQVSERLEWMRGKIESGDYVTQTGAPLPDSVRARLDAPAWSLDPEVRAVLEPVQVRCIPSAAMMYTPTLDLRFDRNRCSTLRPQEPVRVLARWDDSWLLVESAYTLGWISSDTPLSVPLGDRANAFVEGPWTTARNEVVAGNTRVPARSRVPQDGSAGSTIVAAADGFETATVRGPSSARVLTRREFLYAAFERLGDPYGWGGTDGGYDCSRFVMDVFAEFGIQLPRFSGLQAMAGTFSIDVSGVQSETEKQLLIDSAAERGIVLLHFPGHIMVYLGRDGEGVPMAIHSFAEFVEPCDDPEAAAEGRTETLFTVPGVTVSNLELGRGSSRGAFIERITRITVIGQPPGYALQGVAELRPAAQMDDIEAACEAGDVLPVYMSPYRPNVDQPLRFIVTSEDDLGAARFVVHDPDGNELYPEVRRLGGPPFSYVAEIAEPSVGEYDVYFADGDVATACADVNVRRSADPPDFSTESAWELRNSWNRNTENLYSAWVEALFAYPLEEDITWTNFHDVLRNPEMNILYNHYSMNEEEELRLTPDCADLPYFLRGYFAWKVGLPMGNRSCSRGRAGRPPRCDGFSTNLDAEGRQDPVDAIEHYLQRTIRSGVHSACGRTVPDDDETDWYPVEISRDGIRPGTLYADPYGHLLIVARWWPQTMESYGVLMAADAQPDATVGRRRFWRGSFLFTSSTEDVGSGFKAFRPIVRDGDGYRSLTNEELVDHEDFAPYSTEMYEGTNDDFYERVEALINPRPLDPWAMQVALVDALDESVARRVNSVNNGEEHKSSTGYATIDMPTGSSIFLTSGPWEDFSTPSRDMRLLISLDTVVGFPDVVERNPERFGIRQEDASLRAQEIRDQLDDELASRTFEYTRSDGSAWELTLRDIVQRMPLFEISWNPNDCPEHRWAARPGSDEYETCDHWAPDSQRRRMEEYQSWFTDRQRPQ